MRDLCDAFKKSGECSPPLPGSDVDDLVAPEGLKSLLRQAGEWHLRRDHCGAFGVNIFAGKDGGPFFDKAQIMGDAELVEEWGEEHPSPNCAQDGWECFAVVSEYDYLFVCVDPANERHFGATRRVVNNCDEDKEFTPAPFEAFVERLVEFTAVYQEARAANEANEDDEDDCPEFINYVMRQRR